MPGGAGVRGIREVRTGRPNSCSHARSTVDKRSWTGRLDPPDHPHVAQLHRANATEPASSSRRRAIESTKYARGLDATPNPLTVRY